MKLQVLRAKSVYEMSGIKSAVCSFYVIGKLFCENYGTAKRLVQSVCAGAALKNEGGGGGVLIKGCTSQIYRAHKGIIVRI